MILSMDPSLRAAVIIEWRGLAERKTRADRWQSPAELVPKLMQRLGLREQLHETEMIEVWSKIVGEFIAAHSAPVALRGRALRPRSPTGVALRARTDFETRNFAKAKETLRRQNHPRHPFPGWLRASSSPGSFSHYSRAFE